MGAFACVSFALLPGCTTAPNCVAEACSKHEPYGLNANLVYGMVKLLSFGILIAFNRVRARGLSAIEEQGEEEEEEVEDHADILESPMTWSPMTDPPMMESDSTSAEPTTWKNSIPHSVVKVLTFQAVLRFLLQAINTFYVLMMKPVNGSFAQMLIFEGILQHGQLAILIVSLFSNAAFCRQLSSAIPTFNCLITA